VGHNLEAPGTDDAPRWDDVYRCRGDEVVEHRPVFSGDVYSDVEVWGEDDPKTVMVLQHPCVIRSGTVLAKKLLVAEVIPSQIIKPSLWDGYVRQMPLARLMPDAEKEHWTAKFDRHHIVTSKQLLDGTRTACLSQVGLNLAMQRWIHHNSRAIVPTWIIQEVTGAQFEEADIIEDWCIDREDDVVAAEAAIIEIDAWLTEEVNGVKRRDQLKDLQLRAEVRRGAANHLRALRAGTGDRPAASSSSPS
jgi:hypothetical protein